MWKNSKCPLLTENCRETMEKQLSSSGIFSQYFRHCNYLNKIKGICRNHFLSWGHRFPCADDFDLQILTVQTRLKIANDLNFDSTSIRSSGATARMKTNMLKDNISIQFEGEPYSCTPRVHQIVVEDFVFFVALDGLTYFLVQYFQHVLCIVDNKRGSLHENQVVVLSDLVLLLCLKQFPVNFPSSPFFRCSFIGIVFQGKWVVLSDFLFRPTFIR